MPPMLVGGVLPSSVARNMVVVVEVNSSDVSSSGMPYVAKVSLSMLTSPLLSVAWLTIGQLEYLHVHHDQIVPSHVMEVVGTYALEWILAGRGGYRRHGSLLRCHPVAVGAFLSGGMYVSHDAWPEGLCMLYRR